MKNPAISRAHWVWVTKIFKTEQGFTCHWNAFKFLQISQPKQLFLISACMSKLHWWIQIFVLTRLKNKFRNELMNPSDFIILFLGLWKICLCAGSPRQPECRMFSSGPPLTPMELQVAVKIWCLAMSWNNALGGGCNELRRTDFNGLITILPPALPSLLHCRAIAMNLAHHFFHTILQWV